MYREVNEQGIKDFKNLVKELQKAKRIAANKSIITKVVFAEKSDKNKNNALTNQNNQKNS